jgi:hypothetical protein
VAETVSRDRIVHLPHVLYHRASSARPIATAPEAVRARSLPSSVPLVTAIIPTRDHVHLLRGLVPRTRRRSAPHIWSRSWQQPIRQALDYLDTLGRLRRPVCIAPAGTTIRP